jgi:hypothetical protein
VTDLMPTDNGRKARTPTPPPTRVQVEIVRQLSDNVFLAFHGNRRVAVTVADPDKAIKILKEIAGTDLALLANVHTNNVETY